MRRWLCAALLLMPALAGATSKEVQKYLNAAATMIENLDYEKALKQIERARQKSQGAEDDVQVALFEGVVLSELGKTEKALTAFKTGLSMDPDAKLPLEVSPKVEKNFEQARANVKKTLAPQLEREAAEKKRLEEEALAAEKKRKEAERAEEDRLIAQKNASKATTLTPPPSAGVAKSGGGSGARGLAWIPAVGGAALAGAGTYFLLGAMGRYDALLAGTPDPAAAPLVRDEGKSQQTTGLILLSTGVLALGTAGAMFAMGGPDQPAVSVMAGPGGAFIGVSAQIP
jgi:tetratricopeptide (TPR) repeat protein